jgi:twinkle protein
MGAIVRRNQACLKCDSSDAMQIYADGGAKCFSCGTSFKNVDAPSAKGTAVADDDEFEVEETTTTTVAAPQKKKVKPQSKDVPKMSLAEIGDLRSSGFRERLIKKAVCEHYGVKTRYDSNGLPDMHFYPYGTPDERGYKVRWLPKTFSFVGKFGGLFGRELFSGGGKRLVITEGELDALAVATASFEKYGKFYPIVSIPMSTGATAALLAERDWIRSFQEVVIWFDRDEAGEKARDEAIKIIGVDKVRLAKAAEHDACDTMLMPDGAELVLRALWDAEVWRPAGIIGKDELRRRMTAYNQMKSHPYPACMAGVNKKIKGKRFGEVVLFISGTGSGKSTLMREIGLDILETTEDKFGVIYLEESPEETAKKFAGMQIRRNTSDEDIPIDELLVGFDAVFGEDRVLLLDHQGAIKDASIVDQLEYMCLMGCKYLFIDHITILVSEGAEGLTGNEAIDKIMNDLLRLAKRHNVWIGLVSHLRKAATGTKSFEEGRLPTVDDIRGSGSIKQVSFDIIAFARNMTAEIEADQHELLISVLKARYTGKTGQVQGATFQPDEGRFKLGQAWQPAEKGETFEAEEYAVVTPMVQLPAETF